MEVVLFIKKENLNKVEEDLKKNAFYIDKRRKIFWYNDFIVYLSGPEEYI